MLRATVSQGVALFVSMLVLAAPPRLAAQDSTARKPAVRVYHGRIIGVYDDDSGEPIEGVEVRDVFTGWSAQTTKTGNVSLFFVDTAGGMISFRKLGYAPLTMAISNALTDTVPVTVLLTHVGTVLPTVTTTDSSPHYLSPGLRGFEERRRAGHGSYIGEEVLRKMESETMANILSSRLRGATINNGTLVSTRQASGGLALRDARPGLTCYSSVYIDGVLYYPPGDGRGPPDFNRISPAEYAGVEFYADAATMPAWISPTNSQCGVLLLWTRER